MRILFLILAILQISFIAKSQSPPKTKEELEAYINNLKRQSDSLLNNANARSGNKITTKPKDKSLSKEPQLPGKDSIKIASLPRKTLSADELQKYLQSLHGSLLKKFSPKAVSNFRSILGQIKNNAGVLEAAALQVWHTGAAEEALLLITKATTLPDTDGLVITNASALLDMYGMSEKAIPILRTILTINPGNILALNNIGQAYTAIGMRDSAVVYLNKCVQSSPQYPEANAALGFIEMSRGNQNRAQVLFENSLRGSFNISAYTGLKSILKEKCRIAQLIKPKTKLPEYFNQFKYQPIRQCTNVQDAASVQEEYNTYKNMMSKELSTYSKLKSEAAKAMGANWAEDYNKKTMDNLVKGNNYLRPFQVLGSVVEAESNLGYSSDINDLQKFNTDNRRDYQQLEKEYQQAYEQLTKSGSYSCAAENQLKNKYLERFAQLNNEYQSRNLVIENKYIDDFLYWCYFSAFDRKDYQNRFYNKVHGYLYNVNRLSQVKILEPCKEADDNESLEPVTGKEIKEFDCPGSLKISLLVGKLSIDCEKFSLSGGQLLVFGIEKKFRGNRELTLSIGGGGKVELGQEIGRFKGGLSAGIEMSMYVTLDKSGNCTDAGMIYKAYRSMSMDFEGGERIKFERNLGSINQEIGWRFGISSGISFTEPETPFK